MISSCQPTYSSSIYFFLITKAIHSVRDRFTAANSCFSHNGWCRPRGLTLQPRTKHRSADGCEGATDMSDDLALQMVIATILRVAVKRTTYDQCLRTRSDISSRSYNPRARSGSSAELGTHTMHKRKTKGPDARLNMLFLILVSQAFPSSAV